MTTQTPDALLHEPIAFTNTRLRERLVRRALTVSGVSPAYVSGLLRVAQVLEAHPETTRDTVEYYLPRSPTVDSALVGMLGVHSYDPVWVQGVVNVFGAHYDSASLQQRFQAITAIKETLTRMSETAVRSPSALAGIPREEIVPAIVRSIDLPSLYTVVASDTQRESDSNRVVSRLEVAAQVSPEALHAEGRRLVREIGLAPLAYGLTSGKLPPGHMQDAYNLINRVFPGYTALLPRHMDPTEFKQSSLSGSTAAQPQ